MHVILVEGTGDGTDKPSPLLRQLEHGNSLSHLYISIYPAWPRLIAILDLGLRSVRLYSLPLHPPTFLTRHHGLIPVTSRHIVCLPRLARLGRQCLQTGRVGKMDGLLSADLSQSWTLAMRRWDLHISWAGGPEYYGILPRPDKRIWR
jgi:hypothetical protein